MQLRGLRKVKLEVSSEGSMGNVDQLFDLGTVSITTSLACPGIVRSKSTDLLTRFNLAANMNIIRRVGLVMGINVLGLCISELALPIDVLGSITPLLGWDVSTIVKPNGNG